MKLHNTLFSATAALLAAGLGLLAGSCAGEEPRADIPGSPAAITLNAKATMMLPQVLLSRAGEDQTPKTAEEKRIRRLHLFFFDADGNFLRHNPDCKVDFKPYHVVDFEGSALASVSIPKDAFIDQADLEGVQIYAVANAICCEKSCDHSGDRFLVEIDGTGNDGTICHGSPDDKEKVTVIRNLDDIANWYYRPAERTDITKLPAGGMPMVTLYKAPAGEKILGKNGTIDLDMKALMARVDVKVRIDANQTSHDHLLPTLSIKEYGVKSMPLCVPFKEVDPSGTTNVPAAEYAAEKTVKITDRTLVNGQESELFTYYTYENIKVKTGDPKYPSDKIVKEGPSAMQRWKPTVADPLASAFVMRGHYVTHQGLEYEAQFTVFLGSDVVDKFDVRRNNCYKNHISIRGLDYVRNNDDGVYTFDGRVNVKTDNPVYISIVNERKIDAHATALPMDIYFLRMENKTATCPSTVTVKVIDHEKTPWVRMELVGGAHMASPAGTYTNSDGNTDALEPYSPGKGARRYFTTDLVTSTLAANTEITVHNNYLGDHPEEGNRSRIYFYIDENVPTAANTSTYGDRTARISIKYENEDGEVRDRILEIDQKALLKVTNNSDVDAWMEYYEEYLDHKDPLDKHEMPGELYSGLPWGVNGSTSGFDNVWRDIHSYEVYTNGQDFTKWMLFDWSQRVDLATVQLFNSIAPQTCFHYAAGKNKRSSANGSIERANIRWYMPGIRELETGLKAYYSTFPEFSDPETLYWSASSGKRVRTALGVTNSQQERTDYGRATRIDSKGNSVDSESRYSGASGWSNFVSDDPGAQPRSKALRIRAFYKP